MSPAIIEPSRQLLHPSGRLRLRKHVLEQLKGNTLAGCRVFDNRPSRPAASEQPCIYIHSKDEPTEKWTSTPKAYERTLSLWIDVYTEGTIGDPNPMDTMDFLCAQVEEQMAIAMHGIVLAAQDENTDLGFAFNPDKSGLLSTSMDTDDEGNSLEAGARITWQLVYVTEIDEALLFAAKITPFQVAEIQWDLGPDGEIDATDTLRPEQL